MLKVLISGGSGLIGKRLSELLTKEGYKVHHLSRTWPDTEEYKTFFWDWENDTIQYGAIESADYIIHLAGAGIFDKRWTSRRKRQIADSRIGSGRFILNAIRLQNKKKPAAFICASAIGYYGRQTSAKIFTESDPPADDFLGGICRDWEAMADEFQLEGIRTVKLRTGVVISENASIMKGVSKIVSLGLGAALGGGEQFMPWIHIDDLCRIYLKAIRDSSMSGAYNAVAPSHVSNRFFIRGIAEILNKKIRLPNIPAFLLRFIFGKRAVLLLEGSRVSTDKISDAGYKFLYPDLKSAQREVLNRS